MVSLLFGIAFEYIDIEHIDIFLVFRSLYDNNKSEYLENNQGTEYRSIYCDKSL